MSEEEKPVYGITYSQIKRVTRLYAKCNKWYWHICWTIYYSLWGKK